MIPVGGLPDPRFVREEGVTEVWRGILARDYAVEAGVVPNGVDVDRLASGSPRRAAELRASVAPDGRPLVLAVGGLEPRKGSDSLVRALARLRHLRPVLAVLGGHSFQDYRAYRQAVLDELLSV